MKYENEQLHETRQRNNVEYVIYMEDCARAANTAEGALASISAWTKFSDRVFLQEKHTEIRILVVSPIVKKCLQETIRQDSYMQEKTGNIYM